MKSWLRRAMVAQLVIGFAFGMMAANAFAEDMSVSEEILEILKEKGEISDAQYQEMKKKAESEKNSPS